MSKIFVDQVDPKTGTSLTLGTSGDTVNIPSGVTLANAGTVTGLPASAISSGTIATARLGSGTASSSTFLRGDQTYAAAGGTNTPYFEAKMSATQNLTDDTWTKLNYNTEVFDSASAYDTSAYRFTPQTAGKYFCYLMVVFDAQGVDKFHSARAGIYKNGSAYKEDYYDNYDNYFGYGTTGTISVVIDMNGSSDYIEPYGRFNVTSGTGRINNDSNSIFGAYKLIT